MESIFANPLEELIEFGDMNRELERGQGPLLVSGCMDSQKAHLISELTKEIPWKLIVTYDDQRARELYEDYRCFSPDVYLYPARDLLFYSSDIHGNLLTRQRMQVMKHLAEESGGAVITTVDGLMDHLLPLENLKRQCLRVGSGEALDVDKLKVSLTGMGYERVAQVDGMGQFSVRGGIIDIYPLTEDLPFRIELWGDEVDSIRTFDPESQRSVEQLDEALIYPATELVLTREEAAAGILKIEKEKNKYVKSLREQMKTEEAHRIESVISELTEGLKEGWRVHGLGSFIRYFCPETVSFLRYFPEGRLTVFMDEPLRLREKAEVVEEEFRESMVHRLENGYLLPGQADFMFPAKAVMAMAAGDRTLMMLGLEQKLPGISVKKKFGLTVKSVNSYQNGFELLIKDLTRWKKEKYRVVLLSGSRTSASRLAGDLREYDLRAFCPDEGRSR